MPNREAIIEIYRAAQKNYFLLALEQTFVCNHVVDRHPSEIKYTFILYIYICCCGIFLSRENNEITFFANSSTYLQSS
jgi:hypothetical protein